MGIGHESRFDFEFERNNHKALPPMARFAIGIVSQISPPFNGNDAQASQIAKFTRGKVRVDFLFGHGVRIRSGWMPYLKRWARFRDFDKDKDKDNEEYKTLKEGDRIASGKVEVPMVGSRVLVAFVNNAYDDGVVLGCIPSRRNMKVVQRQFEEFAPDSVAMTGPGIGVGLIQENKDKNMTEKVFVFKNSAEVKKDADKYNDDKSYPYFALYDMGSEDGKTPSKLVILCKNFSLQADGKVSFLSLAEN